MPRSRVSVHERPVRELHVALGVGEQDAVDGRVEHRAQHVREPLEVDVLLREVALLRVESERDISLNERGELPDLARRRPPGPRRRARPAATRSRRGRDPPERHDDRSAGGRRRSRRGRAARDAMPTTPTMTPRRSDFATCARSRAAIALLRRDERVDQARGCGRRAACPRRVATVAAAARGSVAALARRAGST